MKKIELLSPAGSMESVYQAVHNGADAVYLGGADFGARAYAANFSYEQMKQAIDFCHLYGVRVFVTVNTLIYQHETNDFLNHLNKIYGLGADAFIIQDIGMMDMACQAFPDIDIHASTQMHNHNDSCLCFVKSLGAQRAVLARELRIDEIEKLKCSIEKEAFVHGALCICYSGQCLFSALTQDRSGNRGKCAQSCRMKYTLADADGASYKTGYLLSPRDIALFEDMSLLKEAGIDCLKVEGRMKPPEYVGLVTKIYRRLLDGEGTDSSDIDDLRKLFNRGFTKGHLLKADELMNTKRPNHAGVPIGSVVSVNRQTITIKLSDTLRQGDGIKFEQADTGFICNRIYKHGKLTDSAFSGEKIELDSKAETKKGDTVVKTSDTELIRRLSNYEKRRICITAKLTAKKGQQLALEFFDGEHSIKVYGEEVQQSRTAPVFGLEQSINKLGDTPFEITSFDAEKDDDIFIAKSAVNFIRREAADGLIAARTAPAERSTRVFVPRKPKPFLHHEPKIHALIRNEEQLIAVKEVINGEVYTTDAGLYRKYENTRLKTSRLSKPTEPMNDERLLVTDNGGLNKYHGGNSIVLDYTMNALNSFTLCVFADMGTERIAISPELGINDIRSMNEAYEKEHGCMPALEALVYGRYELMAMQHCVISHSLGKEKNCGQCGRKQFFLEDIKGSRYPIVTDDCCNNYILHSRCEQKEIRSLFETGVSDFRLEFLYESPEQCRAIAQRYMKELKSL